MARARAIGRRPLAPASCTRVCTGRWSTTAAHATEGAPGCQAIRDGKCKGKLVRLDRLQTELAEPKGIVGATALRPTEFPPGPADWQIVEPDIAQGQRVS